MSGNPQKFTDEEGFALRLAAFYAALFVTLGVQLPFLPVWLAAKGLDASAIGLVLAVPMLLRVFAIPLAARAADRRDALRGTIVIAAAVAVVGYGALGFAQGLVAIMAVYALASVAYAPVFLLTDAYALRGLDARGRAYGPVRLWGSAAFIVASFGAGALLDVIASRDLIWLIVATMALAAATACALTPLARSDAQTPAAHPSAGALLRDPGFLVVAAAASLVQASHALYYGFSTIDWQAADEFAERAKQMVEPGQTASGSGYYEVAEASLPDAEGAPLVRPRIPLAIPYECAHTGDKMGIVSGTRPRAQVLRLIRRGLETTPDQWPATVAAFRAETDATYQKALTAQAQYPKGNTLGIRREDLTGGCRSLIVFIAE